MRRYAPFYPVAPKRRAMSKAIMLRAMPLALSGRSFGRARAKMAPEKADRRLGGFGPRRPLV